MSKKNSSSSHSPNISSGLNDATKTNGGVLNSDFSPKLSKHDDDDDDTGNMALTGRSPNEANDREADEEEETLLDDDRRALLDGSTRNNSNIDRNGANERDMDGRDRDNFGASGSHVSNWKYMSRIFIEASASQNLDFDCILIIIQCYTSVL
jgi:hypothetical protein